MPNPLTLGAIAEGTALFYGPEREGIPGEKFIALPFLNEEQPVVRPLYLERNYKNTNVAGITKIALSVYKKCGEEFGELNAIRRRDDHLVITGPNETLVYQTNLRALKEQPNLQQLAEQITETMRYHRNFDDDGILVIENKDLGLMVCVTFFTSQITIAHLLKQRELKEPIYAPKVGSLANAVLSINLLDEPIIEALKTKNAAEAYVIMAKLIH